MSFEIRGIWGWIINRLQSKNRANLFSSLKVRFVDSVVDEGRFLTARKSTCTPPPPLALLVVILGSLKATLAMILPCFFPWFSVLFLKEEDDTEDFPPSRARSLGLVLLSESLSSLCTRFGL